MINSIHLNSRYADRFTPDEIDKIVAIYNQIDFNSDPAALKFGTVGDLAVTHSDLELVSARADILILAEKLNVIVAHMSLSASSHVFNLKKYVRKLKTKLLKLYPGRSKVRGKDTQSFEEVLAHTSFNASEVKRHIHKMDTMIQLTHAEMQEIKCYLAAGQLCLENNPINDGAEHYKVSSSRERLMRRLGNLDVLLSSHGMRLVQLEDALKQSITLCDCFFEIDEVLIPIWRHCQSSIQAADTNNPQELDAAQQLNEAFRDSLLKNAACLSNYRDTSSSAALASPKTVLLSNVPNHAFGFVEHKR